MKTGNRQVAGRIAPTPPARTPVVNVGADREAEQDYPTWAAYLRDVKHAGTGLGVTPRLRRVATASGMQESVASDGGFATQANLEDEVLSFPYQDGAIASRVLRRPVPAGKSSTKLIVIDETSRADGSRQGGVQVFWAEEADTAQLSKAKFRLLDLAPQKLLAVNYTTDELDTDSPASSAAMSAAVGRELTFTLEDCIVGGIGAIRPLGVLNSPAKIVVTKEAAQAATTFNAANAAKMFARMYPNADPSAVVWLVNPDSLSQILTIALTAAAGISGVATLYVPAVGGDDAAPYGRLIGRPIVPCEHVPTLGSQGDVMLVDLSQYVVADFPPGQLRSIHVKFLSDEIGYRFSYRVTGQPLWVKPTTPKNSAATVSPIVLLEPR